MTEQEKREQEKREKAIEEMANVVRENCDSSAHQCSLITCLKCELDMLYDAGYRKVGEKDHLLTDKEFWALSNKFSRKELDDISAFRVEKAKKEVRKETAKKFAELLCKQAFQGYQVGMYIISTNIIKELAKNEFGVEVEE